MVGLCSLLDRRRLSAGFGSTWHYYFFWLCLIYPILPFLSSFLFSALTFLPGPLPQLFLILKTNPCTIHIKYLQNNTNPFSNIRSNQIKSKYKHKHKHKQKKKKKKTSERTKEKRGREREAFIQCFFFYLILIYLILILNFLRTDLVVHMIVIYLYVCIC